MGSLQRRVRRQARTLTEIRARADAAARAAKGFYPITAADVVKSLFTTKQPTLLRIAKAHALAQRNDIAWDTVLDQMTPEQRTFLADYHELRD